MDSMAGRPPSCEKGDSDSRIGEGGKMICKWRRDEMGEKRQGGGLHRIG